MKLRLVGSTYLGLDVSMCYIVINVTGLNSESVLDTQLSLLDNQHNLTNQQLNAKLIPTSAPWSGEKGLLGCF